MKNNRQRYLISVYENTENDYVELIELENLQIPYSFISEKAIGEEEEYDQEVRDRLKFVVQSLAEDKQFSDIISTS